MRLEHVVGAVIFAMGASYFVMTCVVAPASHGASLVFGVMVGGVMCGVGRSLWNEGRHG